MNELIVTATTGNTVNMRSKPSTTAAILKSIPLKTKVEIIEKISDDWYKIKYSGQEGYMMAKFLKSNNPINQEDLRAIYNSLKDTLVLIEKILK